MKQLPLLLFAVILAHPSMASAQNDLPRSEDVATLDGIIAAYYDVVSHAAGEPLQRERDLSLHFPNARAAITGIDSAGNPTITSQTLHEYHDAAAEGIDNAFYEWEIHREVRRFGNIAHVWSTYAFSNLPDGVAQGRGINSIQLYNDGERWWITDWIFDSEREDNEIPSHYR